MEEGVKRICLGIFICTLALVTWRLTHSFWGWAVLFAGGAFYTISGCLRVFR